MNYLRSEVQRITVLGIKEATFTTKRATMETIYELSPLHLVWWSETMLEAY